MSKIYITIQEAKIVNTEKNKPLKINKKDSKEFSRFCFNICVVLSKKNEQGEWDDKLKKLISYKCTIWNEEIADKFLKNFEPNKKNYITILNAGLSDLQLVKTSQVNDQGNEYTLTSYTNFNLNVKDFVITYKELEEKNTKQEVEASSIKSELEITGDDEILF
jgi:hypothetical protein